MGCINYLQKTAEFLLQDICTILGKSVTVKMLFTHINQDFSQERPLFPKFSGFLCTPKHHPLPVTVKIRYAGPERFAEVP